MIYIILTKGITIDPKALQLASQLAKEETAQEFLEEVEGDRDYFILKIMAVQKLVQQSRMRHQGTDVIYFDWDGTEFAVFLAW